MMVDFHVLALEQTMNLEEKSQLKGMMPYTDVASVVNR